MSLVFCDSSALVKLVAEEAESAALREYLADISIRPGVAVSASELTTTELLRAVSRLDQRLISTARKILDGFHLIDLTSDVLLRAGLLTPASLRSLDAIHLASVLPERRGLIAFVTYDQRMAHSA